MNDMRFVIVPKSDQINADDLIGGPRTITITGVDIRPGTEQPVSIHFDGDEGKPWKPCKSMSRVLVHAWGPDARVYVGRSVTLFRDPSVKWGGMEVGGIRVSHLSHIDRDMVMALTATKGSRKPYKVYPLAEAPAAATVADPAEKWTSGYLAKLASFTALAQVEAFAAEKAKKLAELEAARPDLHGKVTSALALRRTQLEPPTFTDDDFDPPQPAADPAKVEAETPPEAEVAAASASSPKGSAGQTVGLEEKMQGLQDRARADRLIGDKAKGIPRDGQAQADYDALPPDLRAEVDAAPVGSGQ